MAAEWINRKNEIPSTGAYVLAKKTSNSKCETVPSDWVRHHLSQYQFWAHINP